MAEEADDAHGNIADERSQILQLQSEQFRKQEQLDRLRQRSRALEEELSQREFELNEVQRRCNEEKHQGARHAPGEDRARAALAEDDFLRGEVQRLLQSRVPAMAQIAEEGEEDENPLGDKSGAPKQEETTDKLHDTVLISYVQSHDGRQEDYKVSYRISSHTTAEQLHRDACAYWGCSRKDYILWKIGADDKPTPLFPNPKSDETSAKPLQDPEILSPAEAAHLHLCKDSVEIQKSRQKERERERKEGERKAQPAEQGPEQRKSHDVLKTLKHGLGYAINEKQPEEFVDAFRPWPGIFHLLASRDRSQHAKQKWRFAFFSDFLGYAFLILLSALCIGYRNDVDVFLLREGVLHAVVQGIPGETFSSNQLHWLSQSRGLANSSTVMTALTPGIVALDTMVRVNGSVPGAHFARSRQGLPREATGFALGGLWSPAAGQCAEASLFLAAGFQLPAATAPRVAASWSCSNVSLLAANGSEVISTDPACVAFGSAGGYGTVTFSKDGSISLVAGACSISIPAGEYGNWSDLGNPPLAAFLRASGTGELTNTSIVSVVPAPIISWTQVRTIQDLREWIVGPFCYQLFEPSSTLHRHYQLVSPLRIRQQVAKTKTCARQQVPFNLQRKCHEATVTPETEEKATMSPVAGRTQMPASARVWNDSPHGDAGLYGEVQRFYSGSGYSLDIPSRNLTMSHWRDTLHLINTALSDAWLSTNTRLVTIEMLMENKELGGHVVVRLAVECTAAGALHPLAELVPARLADSYGSDVAEGLDVTRWVVVLILLLGVRVWRETKSKVLQGLSGLAYVLSLEGLLDAATVAAFIALQFMRLNGKPRLPPRSDVFRSYTQAAWDQRHLAMLEAVLLLFLILRFASFMRFSPPVFRFFRSFGRALRMFAFYVALFAPVFLSSAFLANSIYGPYLFATSTFPRSLSTLVLAIKEVYKVERLLIKSAWTIPFLTYFWFCNIAFLLFGFLAIAVHAYFEVQLVEGSDPNAESWSLDDWLQWMLWRPVYRYAVRRSESEKRGDGEAEGDQDEEDDSSDEEEQEEKRG